MARSSDIKPSKGKTKYVNAEGVKLENNANDLVAPGICIDTMLKILDFAAGKGLFNKLLTEERSE